MRNSSSYLYILSGHLASFKRSFGEQQNNHFVWAQPFHTKRINFTWSCEINGVTTTTFQTISHVHAKSTQASSLYCNQFSFSSPFQTIMQIYNILFLSSLSISSIFFFCLHLDYLKISSKSQSNYIASSLSSISFAFFNLIHLLHHQFIKIIRLNDSKTS